MGDVDGRKQERVLDHAKLVQEIRETMAARKLSARRAAPLIGISVGTLSKVLTEPERTITVETLIPILEWLHGPQHPLHRYTSRPWMGKLQ